MIKGSDYIAQFLKDKNIKVAFGIIGGANAHIFDSINSLGYTKIVYMHHEQSAVMAAGGYFRVNGDIAAAIVTAGPGSVNAITGVLCNWADSIPCLVISGQEPTKYINLHNGFRMIGVQGFNSTKMVQDIVKYSKTILTKDDLHKTLHDAHSIALSSRFGPVWVDVPMDIQSSKLDDTDITIHEHDNSRILPDINLDEVKDLIESSERPVILAGHGIRLSKSKNSFRELVKKLKIPVLSSWSGIDLLSYNNDYYFGCSGVYGQRCANFVVQNCDLLIVIGSRLALPQTGYDINNFAPNAKIAMVNNDSLELQKYSRYDALFHCDCSDFINSVLKLDINSYRNDWHERCKLYKNDFPLIESCHIQDDVNYDNSYVLINKISKLLDDNHIIAIGQGSPLPCCHQAMEIKENQSIFASNGLGEMGNGLPSSIGAALAADGRKVITLDGDGSMMMNLQELQTIVGYKLPIKIVIFNNNGYLFIKHSQKAFLDGRYTGVSPETGVTFPKFEKIAAAFEIPYFNTKNNTIEEFLNHNGYAILECFMNPEQDLVPKVKVSNINSNIIHHPLEDMSPLLPLEILEKNMLNGINPVSREIR